MTTTPEETPQPTRLTPEEVAEILRYDVETVRRKLRAGALPGRKVGGKWLSPRDKIEQLVVLDD